jgi:hypothetical protein
MLPRLAGVGTCRSSQCCGPGSRAPVRRGGPGIVTEIDFAYFSYEHGGLIGGEDRFYSSGRGYDFAGRVRVTDDQGRWPHIC